jgi:hypothetical protein
MIEELTPSERTRANARDPDVWRQVAIDAERTARRWEQVARNLAQCCPDGAAILTRQIAAHFPEGTDARL